MRRYLLPLALFLVATTATAQAPDDQYDQFSNTTVQIKDKKTKLTWDRQVDSSHNVETPTGAYTSANTYCIGVPGRRIPTIKELLTLFDEDPHGEFAPQAPGGRVSVYVDPDAFPKMAVDLPYWTSTPAGGNQVWTLNFSTGAMTPLDKGGSGAVRCVQ